MKIISVFYYELIHNTRNQNFQVISDYISRFLRNCRGRTRGITMFIILTEKLYKCCYSFVNFYMWLSIDNPSTRRPKRCSDTSCICCITRVWRFIMLMYVCMYVYKYADEDSLLCILFIHCRIVVIFITRTLNIGISFSKCKF